MKQTLALWAFITLLLAVFQPTWFMVIVSLSLLFFVCLPIVLWKQANQTTTEGEKT